MSESTEDRESHPSGKGPLRRSPIRKSRIGFVALLLIAAYALLQPVLNERYGLNLPALRPDSGNEITFNADSEQGTDRSTASRPSGASATDSPGRSQDLPDHATPPQFNSRAPSGNTQGENRTGQSRSTNDQALQPERRPPENGGLAIDPNSSPDLLHGLLKETTPNRYLSPAGLSYGPGSQEGHRLKHLRRHTVDDPNRPGSHGVFDGDMPGALQTIDRAFERAKTGQRTTTRQDDDRTIYTVDMGKRVGFVGGRDGARRNHPLARRVRVVLEGNRVITAYPL